MPAESENIPIVFVGTYTEHEGSRSKGIYVYRLDASSGALSLEWEMQGVRNPSYLEAHPNRGFLYAVSEVLNFADEREGGVSAFSLDATTGEIRPLNSVSSGGQDPCYISIEQTGRFALVANYTGGNAAMLPIQADGRLGAATEVVQHSGSSVDPERQAGPFVHCIRPDPTNRFAIAADLGTDKLVIYRMDLEHGRLRKHTEVKVRPGSGPRHLIFHPGGHFLYLINELSSTLMVFRYQSATGDLEPVQTISTLPPNYRGENYCADLHIYGNYLYASNRGHNSLAWFRIEEETGELSFENFVHSGGDGPRSFAIDPSGSFLLAANQRSDNIVCFRIDPPTGSLVRTVHEVKISQPVCVKFARLITGGE